jgi:DNA-binding Lrp family transcriptional regulator
MIDKTIERNLIITEQEISGNSILAQFSSFDKRLIFYLSGDLGISERPFAEIGNKLGVTEEKIIEYINKLKKKGLIRRFGATVVHQRTGFKANAMLVWRFAEERLDEVGAKLASLPYVSHCYCRCTFKDWPYNLYTMIHASNRERLKEMAEEMSKLTGAEDWLFLESLKELKKESIRYFATSTETEFLRNTDTYNE